MNRRIWLLSLLSPLVLVWAGVATAGAIYPLDAGREWRTTTDGAVFAAWIDGLFDTDDGRAAFVPYGNSYTYVLNAGDMMWFCDEKDWACRTQAEAGVGPSEAYFARQILVKEGDTAIQGGFSIVADDYVELWINGLLVFNATLDANQTVDKQPDPLVFDVDEGGVYLSRGEVLGQYFAADLFRHGSNLLAIRTMDGQLIGGDFTAADCAAKDSANEYAISGGSGELSFCRYSRDNEYLYLSGSIRTVAEPGSLVLLIVGIFGVGVAAQRRRA